MSDKLKVLDLFSGIGGFSLGLERTGGFETVAFCEIEEFPRKVLRKHWPDVQIFEDVRKLDATRLGRIDVVCGGFPCQPWSTAGKQKGTEDDRDLWPEMCRVIADAQPKWVIGENVRGFVNEPMGLERSISDLENLGYAVQSFVIPACGVDAPHKRDRVWIVANSEILGYRDGGEKRDVHKTDGRQIRKCSAVPASASKQPKNTPGNMANTRRNATGTGKAIHGNQTKRSQGGADTTDGCKNVANTKNMQRDGGNGESNCKVSEFGDNSGEGRKYKYWPTEPALGRVANGVPSRVDRLKGLGNAVVPQIPEMIGNAILEAEKNETKK